MLWLRSTVATRTVKTMQGMRSKFRVSNCSRARHRYTELAQPEQTA